MNLNNWHMKKLFSSLRGENGAYSPYSLHLQGEGKGGGVTHNAPETTINHAKSLRKSLTEVEKILWRELRAKRFANYKFRRQHPIGKYIADFACLKSKLIIELDGEQHGIQASYDNVRTKFLESRGFKILRFWNNDVLENKEGVLQTILYTLSPTLSLKGEGVKECA